MLEGCGPRTFHVPAVTLTLIAGVVATALRFEVPSHGLPLAVAYQSGFSGRGLLAGRFGTVVTSDLLTRDGFMLASMVASLAVMLGGYEVLAGARRTATAAIVGAITAPVVVSLALGVGSALKVAFAARALSTLDYGASAITAAGGGALVALLPRRWPKAAAALFVIGGVVVHHQLADWEHLVAFPAGHLLSAASRSPPLSRPGRLRPSLRWAPWGRRHIAEMLTAVAGAAIAAVIAPSLVPAVATAMPSAVATRSHRSLPHTAPGQPDRRPMSPLRVIDTRYPTPSLGGTRRLLIVLPVGYGDTAARYPVIELLHGAPGQPDDILTGLDLIQTMAASSPFIAVIPDGHGPVVTNGDFADTSRQRLGAAVSDDLRRWVNAHYATDPVWAVTGLSAGGYGAAYLGSRPAGGYRRVCAMSGYFTASDPAFQGQTAAAREAGSPALHVARHGPPTMLIVGDNDTSGLADAEQYRQALQHAGQPNQLITIHGSHEWSVWRAGLARCVPFLLGDLSPR